MGAVILVPVTVLGAAIVGAVGAVGNAAAVVPLRPLVAISSLVPTFCNVGLIVVPVGKLAFVIKSSINATAF